MNEDSKAVLTGMWNRRKQEKWVFYNEKEGTRYNRRPKFMRSVCKRAGLPYYGFHCLRHFSSTYAHDVLKVPTGVLSGILGHKEKRTYGDLFALDRRSSTRSNSADEWAFYACGSCLRI